MFQALHSHLKEEVAISCLVHSSSVLQDPAAMAQAVIFLDIDGVLHSLYGEDIFKDFAAIGWI